MPQQSKWVSNSARDGALLLLSTASLGLLIGVTTSFYRKALSGDVKPQQLVTALVFVVLAQACELLERLWRLVSLLMHFTQTEKGKSRWKHNDFIINVGSKLLVSGEQDLCQVTTKLREVFLPENGGCGMPAPCLTPYEDSIQDNFRHYEDSEEGPGSLFADDDSEADREARVPLQAVKRSEAQFVIGQLGLEPSAAVFENAHEIREDIECDADSDCSDAEIYSVAQKKYGWRIC